MISLQGKTKYSESGVGVDRADQTFALDASFCPPPFFSAHTLVLHPYIYMLHKYFVSGWKHQISPHPHNFCFRGFMENNTHRCDGCILKSNEFFWRKRFTSLSAKMH